MGIAVLTAGCSKDASPTSSSKVSAKSVGTWVGRGTDSVLVGATKSVDTVETDTLVLKADGNGSRNTKMKNSWGSSSTFTFTSTDNSLTIINAPEIGIPNDVYSAAFTGDSMTLTRGIGSIRYKKQ
jgi:hypothetical protein